MKKASQKNARKRGLDRTLAPVLRGHKPKKRPSGRPFKKGNSVGLSTRFKPGQSANPGGRPACKKQSEASRAILAEVIPEDELVKHKIPRRLWGRTYAEINAWALEQQGLSGKVGAIAEVVDRAEGRPALSVSLEESHDPLGEILKMMVEIGPTLYGKPEHLTSPKQEVLESGDTSTAVAGEAT